ncbi:Sporulation inhibitor KipI [Tritonibacter multivorans]|uniref:Sporulation inhibitor KipI n=1 Tax=Tritonibacter multivorans TaxID=928856 RepID=A0A0P1G1F7_9RHOB|nr:carboxyltransferase domain-containing protein [Tritonibacter multivorans]MDA7419400.1 carboxyltransferase domain-containing protein [Tritonibacter multivorans]CUH75384.1 Sporulation inhibitor KipI [Tritonibacter multivorans]SFC68483.1 sensor histidine kinase inhibitor, KipI family [Tritonibacter multivorans]
MPPSLSDPPFQPTCAAPDVLPLGLDSFVVRFATHGGRDHPGAVQAYAQAFKEIAFDGVVEVALALASLRVVFDPARTDVGALSALLRDLAESRDWYQDGSPPPRRRWQIPVAFGPDFAPQLTEVATLTGQTTQETIRTLTNTDLRVLAIGFAPGQPYIGLLPPVWDFPRQSDLTPEVPAGALTAALRQLVLFANPSPTGWRQVGLTAFRPFLADRNTAFLLDAGDALCFRAVSDAEMHSLLADNRDGRGGARCEILS